MTLWCKLLALAAGLPGLAAAADPEMMNLGMPDASVVDRKSTRLNSSHLVISYAVFCLKKQRVAAFVLLPALSFTMGMAPKTIQAQGSKPFISPMFSDNMVLQREMRDPVWGWAAPGTQ